MSEAKFVLSRSKVLEQFSKVSELCDIVSYSSKTNPDVTPVLEESSDCMFTLHFVNELRRVKDKSRVFFLAQGWDESLIKSLIEQGVKWFGVDNESDLDVFVKFLDSSDVKINLLLRLKLKENTVKTERYFVFGMDSNVINKRIKELRENKNISLLGVHFHRKTQNMAEWDYKYEISNVLNEDVLKSLDVINIGGGLPAVYANVNINVLPSIFRKIKEFRGWLGDVKLMMEPGRFICASAVKLVTRVINVDKNNIIVNASVYSCDTDVFVVGVKLLVEKELDKGKAYVIKGCTPCSMDIFRYRVYLDDVNVGDSIVFLNAGAYNFSTDFCDLNKVKVEVVD